MTTLEFTSIRESITQERAIDLEKTIQGHYDNDQFYGPSERRDLLRDADEREYKRLTGYSCISTNNNYSRK